MKGLILSGGRGTRLRPLTYTGAKQLVPVANKPVLFYGLEAMAEAGLRQVGLVVGETRAEIEAAVGDGGRWGLEVTYIHQEKPLGLAHALLVSEPFLANCAEEGFVMYLGDNLIRGGIRPLVERFRAERAGGGERPHAQILLARVPHPEQFGVAELEGDRVVRLEEKPPKPRSDLALVGVYMFDSTVFPAVRGLRPSRRGELEITDAIQSLIDGGKTVRSHIIDGWWKDTGKLEDLLEANRLVLDGLPRAPGGQGEADAESQVEFKVRLESGARVVRSRIRGPAIVGEGALVEDSYVGPFTALGPGVVVRKSEVEHSIVMEGSRIEEVPGRVVDSLIGKGVVIGPSAVRPRAYRFVLGDQSQVGIF